MHPKHFADDCNEEQKNPFEFREPSKVISGLKNMSWMP